MSDAKELVERVEAMGPRQLATLRWDSTLAGYWADGFVQPREINEHTRKWWRALAHRGCGPYARDIIDGYVKDGWWFARPITAVELRRRIDWWRVRRLGGETKDPALAQLAAETRKRFEHATIMLRESTSKTHSRDSAGAQELADARDYVRHLPDGPWSNDGEPEGRLDAWWNEIFG